MSELAPLEAYVSGLVAALQPAARKQLARYMAAQLRESQKNRIAAQLNPDGTSFTPRKPQLRQKKGRIRRTMFAKMRSAKYLKANSSADAAIVQFSGEVERIARVNQFGLRDRVNRKRNLEVQYPVRELLGFTPRDTDLVRDMVITHLAR